MNAFASLSSADPWVGLMASAAIKGSFLLGAVLLLDLALRSRSAALRHRLWTATFGALLLLPLVAPLVPSWNLPILPERFAPALSERTEASDPTGDEVAQRDPAADRGEAEAELLGEPSASGDAGSDGSAAEGIDRSVAPTRAAIPWRSVAIGLWIGGALLLALRLGVATLHASRLCRAAAEVRDPSWSRTLDAARRQLGITAPVRLLRSDGVMMPMAWGLRRHAVVLPESAEGWTEERRRVVLLHELAHIRRGDCLAHLLSGFAAALYWLNPLVWIARRRQTAERELACDDTVLASGAPSADYAWHLLEIARGSGNRLRFAPAGVMMARKSQLEGRLLAVLDGTRDRRNVSRAVSWVLSAASFTLVVALAGLQPWAVPTVLAAEGAPASVAGLAPSGEAQEAGAPVTEAEVTPTPQPGPTGGVTPTPGPQPTVTGTELEMLGLSAQDRPSRERVIELMVGLLDDADPAVRKQAIHSLGRMEDPRAVTALAAIVVDDPDANARSQAAWSLGMIESAEAVGALSRALSEDADPDVRSQAAWALGMIESPEAVPALSQALTGASEASVRSQAAWALGMIESPDSVPGLVAALGDDDPDLRSQAAWALGMIESADAVDGLVTALRQDADPSVRSQAAWALGMIEDERALEALIDAVEDGDDAVRKQALWAINMIVG